MKKKEIKLRNGMKLLGTSLLFLVIPGSLVVLPWLLYTYKKRTPERESNEILGI